MRLPDPGRLLAAIWYGSSPVAWFLLPLAALFGLAVAVRRRLYRAGALAVRRLPVPVIVVGNITVGGTGKTPVVEWLVRLCLEAGYRPGVVSRGYGGRARKVPHRVRAADTAAEVGDEPLLLHRRTGVPVSVCTDRAAAGLQLVAAGVDVVIADDGLQHYRLGRDLEIAVVDGDRRLGNG
ncbi:MAG: tetraacyldisaccharide 4'-kinase, partial [Gammaproteobacteria bacterium]|nr:tetraacyldisaccharide 4'-kinase [Gammaproteobacteria bacterium]